MTKDKSFVRPLALFCSFFVVVSIPQFAYSDTDVFTTWGGQWRVSLGGTGAWQVLNTSDVGIYALRFGDFDGNCRTDVFTTWGGTWRVSFNGTGAWQVINTSNVGVTALLLGDFDGDGNTDVFTTWGGKWRISLGGIGPWQVINKSDVGVFSVRLADFDGDNKDDVFATWGGKWHVSFGGTGAWKVLTTSDVEASALRFGDFNGDGKADVFTTWGGKWRVSFGGTGAWQVLNTSDVEVSALRLGDFNGDGKADVFSTWGGKWRVSFGGTGAWQVLNASDVEVSALSFGDFNGDGSNGDAAQHVCLRVSRFTTANLNNADVDAILDNATAVLQGKHGSDDVACLVQFKRRGTIGVFTTGNGSINTEADLNTILGLPGHVKVVNQINFCNDKFKPGIAGCGLAGDSQVVEARAQPTLGAPGLLEGILWLHEYGHTRGLHHRNDPNAVMNDTLDSSQLRVNSSECTAFQK
jgi:hypothetical protein